MIGIAEKKKCFVVTPIGNNDTEIRRHIEGIIDQAITPALGEKYDIDVAHRNYEIGSINDRVIKCIFNSDLVIANLTGLNPNVMFELAIRYSFGKPALVIAEKGTKLPFDINDENVIFYINDPAGAFELKEKIILFETMIDFEKKNYGPVYKAVNTIPLYKDVESGKEVSNDKLLTYVIDRLNSIEKNISKSNSNGYKENLTRNYNLFVTFENDDWDEDEMNKICESILVNRKGILGYHFFPEGVCFLIEASVDALRATEAGKQVINALSVMGVNVKDWQLKSNII